MKRLVMQLLAGIATLALLRGEIIGEANGRLLYRQPDGITVHLPLKPKRVVVAYASLAPVWLACGGEAVAVPASRDKNALPEGWRNLPKIGSGIVPNLEKIVAQEPDLVLLIHKVERNRAAGEALRKLGVTAVNCDYSNYRDYRELLELFCRLNGRKIGDLPQVAAPLREVEAICAAAAKRTARPRFAILFAGASGFWLESERTHTGTIGAMLGGRNVVGDSARARIRFGMEPLLLADPEVIFVVPMGDAAALREKFEREIAALTPWKTLRAVRENRVVHLPPELFLYLPGERFPEAFRIVDRALYPSGGEEGR